MDERDPPPVDPNLELEPDGVVVLNGGFDGSYPGDTWEWDGTTWAQRSSSPPPYDGPPVIVRGQVVLYDY